MANFEAPSFSLGFDDSDTETLLPNLQFPDSDPEPELQPSRVFKRLRRGLSNGFTPSQQNELPEMRVTSDENVADDIEEFSSQENPISAEPSSAQCYTMCSSFKFPQHGSLSFHLAGQSKFRTKPVPQAPGCCSSETCSDKVIFPKLTISPLRRFQLIDSDSDDLPEDGKTTTVYKKFDAVLKEKEKQSTPAHTPSINVQRRGQASTSTSQTEDLWKDFSLIKSLHIPTPTFDEICEEYFQRVHDKNVNKVVLNDESTSKSYAFNENNDSDRNQFCHGETSKKQANMNSTVETSSRNGRKNSRKSKVKEVHHASEGWVNPKSGPSVPKDAGKRRVHAEICSSGHWFTGADGRRVYVNKLGQELTGQIAYRNYRKESGGGFKKTAKKIRAKKK